MIARADHPGIGGQRRRLVGYGAFEPFANVRELVDFLMELTKQFAAPSGRRRKKLFEHRKLRQRFAQRYEFARRRQPQRGAAGKPFEIEDALELLANFTANNGLLDEVCDGIKTALNGLTLNERPEKPGAQ